MADIPKRPSPSPRGSATHAPSLSLAAARLSPPFLQRPRRSPCGIGSRGCTCVFRRGFALFATYADPSFADGHRSLVYPVKSSKEIKKSRKSTGASWMDLEAGGTCCFFVSQSILTTLSFGAGGPPYLSHATRYACFYFGRSHVTLA